MDPLEFAFFSLIEYSGNQIEFLFHSPITNRPNAIVSKEKVCVCEWMDRWMWIYIKHIYLYLNTRRHKLTSPSS